MPLLSVEITPTIESAPALLMEIAALIERGGIVPPLPEKLDLGMIGAAPLKPVDLQPLDMIPDLTPVWFRGGYTFHCNDTCGAGGAKRKPVLVPLFMSTERVVALKKAKSSNLCDYCFKLGRRRATIRRHKVTEMVQAVANTP